MSIGFASAMKTKKSVPPTRVNFAGLFDWTAEHLSLATPRYVVGALSGARENEYVEALRDYIPRAHVNTLHAFKQLSYADRMHQAQAWFKGIEPGHVRFQEPAW